MKQLTLALLLSLAPAALNADTQPCLLDVAPEVIEATTKCGCDCGKATEEEIKDDRCCGLAELAVLDAAEAFDKTTVTITIRGEDITLEEWESINNYVSALSDTAMTIGAHAATWEFNRGERALDEWFNYLVGIEGIFLATKDGVATICGDAATVTLHLN
jgi:hypothetical protein